MRKNTLQPMLDLYIEKGGDKAWTQGSDARDIEGRWLYLSSSRAVSWCLSGALRSWGPYPLESRIELTRRIRKEGHFPGILTFNDHESTTWGDVVRVLSRKDTSIWERMLTRFTLLDVVGGIVVGLLIGAIAGRLLI